MSDRGFISQARHLLQDEDISALISILQSAPDRLEEIKHRAHEVDSEEAKAAFSEMSDEKQTEVFDGTVADLAITFQQLRSDPADGVEQIQSEIRNPYTVEALLAVFDNDEHIDDEYSEQIKEFVRWRFRFLGVHALPEAYTEAEKREVIDRFDLEYDPEAENGTNN